MQHLRLALQRIGLDGQRLEHARVMRQRRRLEVLPRLVRRRQQAHRRRHRIYAEVRRRTRCARAPVWLGMEEWRWRGWVGLCAMSRVDSCHEPACLDGRLLRGVVLLLLGPVVLGEAGRLMLRYGLASAAAAEWMRSDRRRNRCGLAGHWSGASWPVLRRMLWLMIFNDAPRTAVVALRGRAGRLARDVHL